MVCASIQPLPQLFFVHAFTLSPCTACSALNKVNLQTPACAEQMMNGGIYPSKCFFRYMEMKPTASRRQLKKTTTSWESSSSQCFMFFLTVLRHFQPSFPDPHVIERGKVPAKGLEDTRISKTVNFLLFPMHFSRFSPLLWLLERVLGRSLRCPQRVLGLPQRVWGYPQRAWRVSTAAFGVPASGSGGYSQCFVVESKLAVIS